MFRLNKKLVVWDITAALENEAGKSLISAPTVETLQIRLEKRNVEIYLSTYVPGAKLNDALWTVVKIGELGGK
jgi:hypothetical protein